MTYPAVSLVLLTDYRLSHRRRINREPSLFAQGLHFIPDMMSDSTCIHEDDNLAFSLSSFCEFHDFIEDEFFDGWIVDWGARGERCGERCGRYFLVDHVSRNGEVGRADLRRMVKRMREGEIGQIKCIPR